MASASTPDAAAAAAATAPVTDTEEYRYDACFIQKQFKALPRLTEDVRAALQPLLACMEACHQRCDIERESLDEIVEEIYDYIQLEQPEQSSASPSPVPA